jgi:hypothetical protein
MSQFVREWDGGASGVLRALHIVWRPQGHHRFPGSVPRPGSARVVVVYLQLLLPASQEVSAM